MDVLKYLKGVVLVMLLQGLLWATTQAEPKEITTGIEDLVCAVYCLVTGLLPIIGFLLIALAGAVYAAGQFFGAQMRAQTSGWAMNLIAGAVISFIIVAIGPVIINAMYTNVDVSSLCTC